MVVVSVLIGLILALTIFKKFFGQRWFAYLMNRFSHSNLKNFGSAKKELFKPLKTIKPSDSQSKNENGITILEVGVGTGTNFTFYPNGTKLIVVDPNPHFKQYYEENRKTFSNILSEEIIVTTGEEMGMIKSNSIDAVVITHVFCSVTDIKAVLQEVHRVLRQGGKFFFFEHIEEFDDAYYIRRMLQQFLTKTNIWPFIFDNCHLNRDILTDLETVGFSYIDAKKIHLPLKVAWEKIVASHLVGVATK